MFMNLIKIIFRLIKDFTVSWEIIISFENQHNLPDKYEYMQNKLKQK